ncbi:MAG: bifunctional folylpolyglutamate synthase/dihydrofolate synthase [Thermoanaerobaculia bacterium]
MSEPLPRLTGDPFQALESLSPRGVRLGLQSMREILQRLGHPERKVPRVLVAGTNGKGSVAATLSAICREAGIRSGLHTSPHLIDLTERIRIEDQDVDRASLGSALERVLRAAAERPAVPVTYFEAVTAASELLFLEENCEFAVVEVGLGGRLDATNAGDPALSIVASIGLDHIEDLGGTVEAIAREKAGTFRKGRPAICGGSDPVALRVLSEEARRSGARFIAAESSIRISGCTETSSGQAFRLETPREIYEIRTPLRGAHQAGNVGVAVLAAEELGALDRRFSREAIGRGVERTRWPGRLEAYPVEGRVIWLDGCHNPAGAAAVSEFFEDRPPFDLLFGAMEDKDIAGIAQALFPLARRIILTAPAVGRAASPESLQRLLSSLRADTELAVSSAEGMEKILRGGSPEALVAGSLFLVGEARRFLLDMSIPAAARA